MGWPPNVVEPGDAVLVWGGAGGLGSMAIDITRAHGRARGRGRVGRSKSEFCLKLGAVGVIDRRKFDHWGKLPAADDTALRRVAQGRAGVRRRVLGGARREEESDDRLRASGRGHAADLGLRVRDRRHGRDLRRARPATTPRSTCAITGCARSGCRAATSRMTNRRPASRKLVAAGECRPNLSATYRFDDTPECHQLMLDNKHP